MIKSLLGALALTALTAAPALAVTFQHVVVVIQENRTPDNLFYGLCSQTGVVCSTSPTAGQYNILTTNWVDKNAPGGSRNPSIVPLGTSYDIEHNWASFNTQCDMVGGACRADQSSPCAVGPCPAEPSYGAVVDTHLQPYYDLVRGYGWGNYFFATNEGSSWPGHQMIFGDTTAVSQAQDNAGNLIADAGPGGCISGSPAGVVGPHRTYIGTALPCVEHTTLSDLLEAKGLTWAYYGVTDRYWPDPNPNGLWTAPNSIQHICGTDKTQGQCVGSDFTSHVKFTPSQVLTDIQNCALANMVWVTPEGQASDHSNGGPTGVLGPAWVASIVNAVGNSACKNPDGSTYWNSTAIIVTWDDWGGWYDHVLPPIAPAPDGGTEFGFRVPVVVVSAYTSAGITRNKVEDFSSITRFAEKNFGIAEGALGLTDAHFTGDLSEYFPRKTPRAFVPIATPGVSAQTFLLMDADTTRRPTPPDTD